MAKSKTAKAKDVAKDLAPSVKDVKEMTKVGATVMTGLYLSEIGARVVERFTAGKIPNVPYVSNKTVGSGITALGLWIGYKKVPKSKIPFIGMDTKQVMKYATAGAFARTVGGLVVDILQETNINPFGLTSKIEAVME